MILGRAPPAPIETPVFEDQLAATAAA